MKTPITPQGLPPADREDGEGLEPCYSAELVEQIVSEALAAQAATLESIHKIIECAGPEAADEIADLLGYPSVEWPSDQAASVEPVGEVMEGIQTVGFGRKEIQKFVQFDQSLPVGTKLYASAPPSPASVPGAVEPLARDDIDKLAKVLEVTSLDEVEPETVYAFTRAIEARFAPQPQAVAASSPEQAVDAEDERIDALKQVDRFFVERLAELGCLSPEAGAVHAMVRAALQASRQPQAQQGGGDLSIYKARWCFALAESDDWTYAVCKWDGADWLPIKTEDDLRIFDAALATKEPRS